MDRSPAKLPAALAGVLLLVLVGAGCPRAPETSSGRARPPPSGGRASLPAARALAEDPASPTVAAPASALLPDLSWLLREDVLVEIRVEWMIGIGTGHGFAMARLLHPSAGSRTEGVGVYAVFGSPAARRPPRASARWLDVPAEPTKRFLAALASPGRKPQDAVDAVIVTHTDTYERVEVTVSSRVDSGRVARWRTTTNRPLESGLQWSLGSDGAGVTLDSGALNEAFAALAPHLHLDEARRSSGEVLP